MWTRLCFVLRNQEATKGVALSMRRGAVGGEIITTERTKALDGRHLWTIKGGVDSLVFLNASEIPTRFIAAGLIDSPHRPGSYTLIFPLAYIAEACGD